MFFSRFLLGEHVCLKMESFNRNSDEINQHPQGMKYRVRSLLSLDLEQYRLVIELYLFNFVSQPKAGKIMILIIEAFQNGCKFISKSSNILVWQRPSGCDSPNAADG